VNRRSFLGGLFAAPVVAALPDILRPTLRDTFYDIISDPEKFIMVTLPQAAQGVVARRLYRIVRNETTQQHDIRVSLANGAIVEILKPGDEGIYW
jgi:hypothetical protein